MGKCHSFSTLFAYRDRERRSRPAGLRIDGAPGRIFSGSPGVAFGCGIHFCHDLRFRDERSRIENLTRLLLP